jgi:hypothetical protein
MNICRQTWTDHEMPKVRDLQHDREFKPIASFGYLPHGAVDYVIVYDVQSAL